MIPSTCILSLVFAVVIAEPPASSGYQPSGWRPSGPVFNLPNLYKPQVADSELKSNQPELQYGPPAVKQVANIYPGLQETLSAPPNRPAVTYGPPEQDITTEGVTEEDLVTTTDNPERENATAINVEGLKEDLKQDSEKGVYYIYHPTGLLQKVTYVIEDDQAKMAYSAKLKYENVEPISGPVYTYDPQSYEFKRLQ